MWGRQHPLSRFGFGEGWICDLPLLFNFEWDKALTCRAHGCFLLIQELPLLLGKTIFLSLCVKTGSIAKLVNQVDQTNNRL